MWFCQPGMPNQTRSPAALVLPDSLFSPDLYGLRCSPSRSHLPNHSLELACTQMMDARTGTRKFFAALVRSFAGFLDFSEFCSQD